MPDNKTEKMATVYNPINDLTEVKYSPIEGNGIFAKNFIPKGTTWWRATPEEILFIKREQYLALEKSNFAPKIEDLRYTILLYSFYNKEYDALVFCLDNARYTNHSYTPNSANIHEGDQFLSKTLRDILPGEELLEDYTTYELCPWANIHEAFLVEKPEKK